MVPVRPRSRLDRRRINTQIAKLRREIARHEDRPRHQARRAAGATRCPSVAIAGYTNAGKSSLLNRLTGAGVLVENALFATLDPTVRRAETADGRVYTLTDTVGFVRHLPHQLVEAFRSTLEEVADADLILHVVDGSHPDPEGQIAAVREVLAEIGADQVPEIVVVNKVDAADPMVLDRLRRASRTASWCRPAPARASTSCCALIDERAAAARTSRSTCWCPTTGATWSTGCTQDGEVLSSEHTGTARGSRPRSTGTWSASSRPTPSEAPPHEGHRRRAVPFVPSVTPAVGARA